MTICRDCGAENLPGADLCEQCQQPLSTALKPASGIERALLEDKISKLPPRSPLITGPNTPIRDVLKLLVAHSVGCVIVVDADEVVGIFSERDALLKLNIDAAKLADRPVSQFMTASPEMLQENDKIAFAIHRMDLGGYRHIPILAQGKVVGIISIRDILDYLTERIPAAQPA
jgi:CBS domain-containing protein